MPWLAAATWSGTAVTRAPSTTSTIRLLVSTLPAATAAGRRHLGFVQVTQAGDLVQTHYSGLARYRRLARGDLRSWYAASPFRGADLQLHLVQAESRAGQLR